MVPLFSAAHILSLLGLLKHLLAAQAHISVCVTEEHQTFQSINMWACLIAGPQPTSFEATEREYNY